jgi:hypothetical protein
MTVEVEPEVAVVGAGEVVMNDGGEVAPPKLAEAAFRGWKLAQC